MPETERCFQPPRNSDEPSPSDGQLEAARVAEVKRHPHPAACPAAFPFHPQASADTRASGDEVVARDRKERARLPRLDLQRVGTRVGHGTSELDDRVRAGSPGSGPGCECRVRPLEKSAGSRRRSPPGSNHPDAHGSGPGRHDCRDRAVAVDAVRARLRRSERNRSRSAETDAGEGDGCTAARAPDRRTDRVQAWGRRKGDCVEAGRTSEKVDVELVDRSLDHAVGLVTLREDGLEQDSSRCVHLGEQRLGLSPQVIRLSLPLA